MKWLQNLLQPHTRLLENVTPRVQQVFKLARQHADRLGHDLISVDHFWLGLLDLNEGVGLQMLRHHGIDPAALRHELEISMAKGNATASSLAIPMTAACREVLNLGAQDAAQLHAKYFGTEHLLLGLLQTEACANRALQKQTADMKLLRKNIKTFLTSSPSETAA